MRLLNAGVYYNHRDSSSSVGIGQLVLGLAVLVLAGIVLGGGAIVLLGSSPRATPTHVATGPTPSDQPSTTPTQSAGLTPGMTLPPTPTLIATAPSTLAPTPTPSPAATPTPEPSPVATPIDCAVASQGANVKEWQLGLGHDTARLLQKTWCIRNVTIDSWSGWGEARLMLNNKVVFQASCLPTGCATAAQDFVPPYQANRGKTLRYLFTCYDDPATPDPINECTDATPDGAVITIQYEAFVGP